MDPIDPKLPEQKNAAHECQPAGVATSDASERDTQIKGTSVKSSRTERRGLMAKLRKWRLKLSLKPQDTPQGITEEVHAAFLRQEHRTFHIIRNFLSHRNLPEDDYRREPTSDALFSRLLLSSGARTAVMVGGGGVCAIAAVILAKEANEISKSQAKISTDQNAIASRQTQLMGEQNVIAESQRLTAESQNNLLLEQTKLLREQNEISKSGINQTFVSQIKQIGQDMQQAQPRPGVFADAIRVAAALTPYSLQVGDFSKTQQVSPERGQLLVECVQSLGSPLRTGAEYESLMRTCNFNNALIQVPLSNKHLVTAWLTGAVLFRCELSGTDFTDARLQGAKFRHCAAGNSGANKTIFKASHANSCEFEHCALIAVDFSDAELINASFAHSTLKGVVFNGADLTGAKFTQATLIDVQFREGCRLPNPEAFEQATVINPGLDGAFTKVETWEKSIESVVKQGSHTGTWRKTLVEVPAKGAHDAETLFRIESFK